MSNYEWQDKVILVVEDNDSNYLYIEAVLEDTKAKILWAKEGAEAIKLVESEKKIDLILMDIQMPGLNGYEATKALKEMRKDIPIIAQTAYAMENDRDKIMNAGCDDYLAKPIKVDTLLQTVSKYLDK
jgi:two-component system, cell cycle response regulator DivK